MAVIKPGPLVADVRGKVGGSVFQGGQGGLVLRNNTTPINPASNLQLSQRALYFRLQVDWSNLTDAQRQQWEQWALFQNNTQGRFSTLFQSGQVAFVQANYYRLVSGLAELATPVFTPLQVQLSLSGITSDIGVPNLIVVCTSADSAADVRPIIRVSSVTKPTRRSNKESLLLVTPLSYASFDYDITASYTEKFGTLPPVGGVVFIQFMYQSTENGALSIQATTRVIVTEP